MREIGCFHFVIFKVKLYRLFDFQGVCWSGGTPKEDLVCNKNSSLNRHLCLPIDYNKFDLPFSNNINIIDIGINIVDVLRINDKVS